MISIKNTQRSIKIDSAKLASTAQKILELLDYADFDLGIWFTSDATIRKYNRQYRNKDTVTDILSFPFYPALKAGQRIKTSKVDEKNLGDIIIAPAYVKKAADQLGTSFENRMKILLVHGICHLIGYDHIKDEDYAVMHKKEQQLLKKLETD